MEKTKIFFLVVIVILFLLSLLWVYVISPIIAWTIQNLLLIGIIVVMVIAGFFVFMLHKEKERKSQEIEEKRVLEIKKRKRREFELQQRTNGLECFGANGEEKWGTPAQVAEWTIIDKSTKGTGIRI